MSVTAQAPAPTGAGHQGRRPGPVDHLVAALGGAGLVALLASLVAVGIGPLGPRAAGLFVATVLSVLVPLRFQHRGQTHGLTLDEGMLVAMLFTLAAAQPPLLHAGAVALAHVLLRNGRQKTVFNAGQIALATSAAAAVFRLVGPGERVLSGRSVLALLAAVLVHNLITSLALAELFRRLQGQRYRQRLAEVWRLNLVTLAGNASFGLLLAFVVREDPWAAALATTLMLGLYLGYRGYAGLLEERERNDRLQAANRTLTNGVGSPKALEAFLAELAQVFSGEAAELLLLQDGGFRTLSYGRPWQPQQDPTTPPAPLTQALTNQLPALRTAASGPAARDAIAAPLVVEGTPIGAVAVYDRHGLEPWDTGDATLLAALAHEVAVAVKNVELFSTVLEESRRLRNIVDAASDGIALVDRGGRVAAWNPGMAEATGVAPGDAVGQPWEDLLGGQDPSGSSAMAVVLRGERLKGPVDVEARRGGDRRWLRCTFSPVLGAGDEAAGAVVVARDVTRERESEELKRDFVATVSHELRTPLTPLKGFLLLAARRWREMSPEQVDVALSAMLRQVDRLEALIADLLVVADLDRDKYGVEPRVVELAPLVRRAVDQELKPEGAPRVVVEASVAARVSTDPNALTRVVRALVSNALKHTTGEVRVRLEHRGAEVAVVVADEGPGIAPWDQQRVFERFVRLGSHLTRETQGAGLGLAIARSLAERFGGRLELESELGRGTRFVLSLECLQADDPAHEGTTLIAS